MPDPFRVGQTLAIGQRRRRTSRLRGMDLVMAHLGSWSRVRIPRSGRLIEAFYGLWENCTSAPSESVVISWLRRLVGMGCCERGLEPAKRSMA